MKLLTGALRAARDNKRFLVGMSLLFAFRACIADWAVVPSGSMNPTLIEGDYILSGSSVATSQGAATSSCSHRPKMAQNWSSA